MQTLELLDDKVGPIGCSHLSSVLIKVRPAVPFTLPWYRSSTLWLLKRQRAPRVCHGSLRRQG